MPRLPFDASSVRGGDDGTARPRAAGGGRADRGLPVGEVCRLIKTALETGLPATLRVEGEVSGLSHRNHWYFTLKDDEGVLQCVAWATAAARFGFVPADGELVVATGSVSHYAPQGRTQFYVSRLEPLGTGALAVRFKALCDELRRLGYLDEARKRPLPAIPRRIAVITSISGAALQDVIDTARRRWPAVGLLLVDVRVQGEGAAAQVAEAIGLVDRHARRLGIDAILVTRGGGSIEDLWAFNERSVADAAFRCRVPLVAAIGHESDTTVIELVADVRAATPTQAVMRLIPDRRELLAQARHLRERLALVQRRHLDAVRHRLVALRRSEMLRRPQALIHRQRERLDLLRRSVTRGGRLRVLTARRQMVAVASTLARLHPRNSVRRRRETLQRLHATLRQALTARLQLRRQSLDGQARALNAVDPSAILSRGYSITTRADGSLLRRAVDASTGTVLLTRLADGTVRSVTVDPEGGPSLPAAPRRPRAAAPAGGMDLFDQTE